MDYAIEYSGFPTVLEGYSDANWISDSDETKSTSGYVFTLGGGAVTWRSARQTIIARSTMVCLADLHVTAPPPSENT